MTTTMVGMKTVSMMRGSGGRTNHRRPLFLVDEARRAIHATFELRLRGRAALVFPGKDPTLTRTALIFPGKDPTLILSDARAPYRLHIGPCLNLGIGIPTMNGQENTDVDASHRLEILSIPRSPSERVQRKPVYTVCRRPTGFAVKGRKQRCGWGRR